MRPRNSELARGVAQSSVERHEKEKSNSETMDLLRRILFRQEREKLAELSKSVESLKTQLTVPEVLADNLEPYIGRILARRFAESPEEMAQLLSPIVAASIRYQIREAKDDVIEILYPIMAEAINRQIEEAEGEVVEVFYPLISRMIAKAILEAVKNPFRKASENLRGFLRFKDRNAEFTRNSEVFIEHSLPERESEPPPKIHQRTFHKKSTPLLQYITVGLIIILTTVFGVLLINYYMGNPRSKPDGRQNSGSAPDIITQASKAQAEIEGILKENPILFDTAEKSVPRRRWDTLNEIVKILKKYPSVSVRITGYSDTSDEDNIDSAPPISLKRAEVVKEYLQSKGMRSDRLQTMDGGATDKFSADTTPSGQWMNRRVEFEALPYERATD